MTHSTCFPSMGAVPGLDALEIEPSLPVLAEATASVKTRRAQLEAALLSLGVTSVEAAREEYAIRCDAEVEDTVLRAQMEKLAPEGLAALDQQLTEIREERLRLEAALAEARRTRAEGHLIEVTPQRIEELRGKVDQIRESARIAEQILIKARKVFEDHDVIKIELERNRITKEAFAHLRRVERELRESEAELGIFVD